MNIDLFSATGTKKGTLALPASLFEARVNQGLMHQVVMLQQGNRRTAVAHAKNRGEVAGSTRKLYSQKHTGRARRGSVRSPLLRGGGKAFGPRSIANFAKRMPRGMRRAALLSCLSLRAKQGDIIGLENYPETVKTKDAHALLRKLPVQIGRRLLFVLPGPHRGLQLSTRNIPGVKSLPASYLNPEDVLGARQIVFLAEALRKAEELWGEKNVRGVREVRKAEERETKDASPRVAAKKPAKKRTPTKSSQSSQS